MTSTISLPPMFVPSTFLINQKYFSMQQQQQQQPSSSLVLQQSPLISFYSSLQQQQQPNLVPNYTEQLAGFQPTQNYISLISNLNKEQSSPQNKRQKINDNKKALPAVLNVSNLIDKTLKPSESEHSSPLSTSCSSSSSSSTLSCVSPQAFIEKLLVEQRKESDAKWWSVSESTIETLGQTSRRCKRCRCPFCINGINEAELNQLIANNLISADKKRVHLCHVCNKIYGKTSHLKAHLRWHAGNLD